MRIWIDCEWNDWQGNLISMALVAEDGREFYEELRCLYPTKWVFDNVMPHLHGKAITHYEFGSKLRRFLEQFDEIAIIADWPEDIKHFCDALIIGPGQCLLDPIKFMSFVRPIKSQSEIPHHALWDARANKKAMLEQEEKDFVTS